MRELNLAAMALLIVIVTPMIIGWAWPSGTETVDTWTTEGNIDITPSIATTDIPILDSYSGPMNHYWLYSDGYTSYEPVAYASSPSAIPKLTYTSTAEAITTNPYVINLEHFTGYRTDFITAVNIAIIMNDHTVYSCSTAVYMPGANAIYMIGLGHHAEPLKASDIRSISVSGATASNPVLLTTRTYTQTGEYVDMSKGFILRSDLAPYYLDWFNGMTNHSVELWIRTASIAETSTITAGGLAVELDATDGTLTANGQTLGAVTAYPFISIVFDHDEGTATVSGLIGASSFTDPTWTVGNVVTIDGEIALISSLRMSGDFEYEVKRTYSEIGTGKGIKDATIIPYDYYPHYSWQVSFDSPARFGDFISIGGLPHSVFDGKIQIHDRITGERHDVPIRGMAILSLIYYDGEEDEAVQHLYVNGIEISTLAPEQELAIILAGDWYVSVTVSDVSQGEQTGYTWTLGTFGLDRTGYCMVGLLSSITIMIGAGLWGRASGTKLLVVMITMGICAASYFLMM